MIEYIIASIITAAALTGGFFVGWTARDRVRGDGEQKVTLVEKPLGKPINVATAGRHIPDKR